MAEAAANHAIRVRIEKIDGGSFGGPNSIKQIVGTGSNGATGPNNIESPTNTDLKINDAQLVGLVGYIGLIKAGVDTSSLETSIASAVLAN